MATESTTARYVSGGGSRWRDPWPAYAALREHDPVHHVVPPGRPDQDYYVLARHADVLAAAIDTETFSSARGLTVAYDDLEELVRRIPRFTIDSDQIRWAPGAYVRRPLSVPITVD